MRTLTWEFFSSFSLYPGSARSFSVEHDRITCPSIATFLEQASIRLCSNWRTGFPLSPMSWSRLERAVYPFWRSTSYTVQRGSFPDKSHPPDRYGETHWHTGSEHSSRSAQLFPEENMSSVFQRYPLKDASAGHNCYSKHQEKKW